MKLNDAALTNGSATVKVESRTRALVFRVSTNANDYAASKTALAACLLSLELNTPNGVKYLASQEKFTDLLEFSASNSGAIVSDKANAATVFEASYELCEFGTLNFGGERDLRIKFEAIPANYSIDVYALDAEIDGTRLGNFHNVIERVQVTSAVKKSVDVRNCSHVFLPIASTTLLEMVHTNGRIISMLPAELRNYAYETNPQVLVEDGVTAAVGFLDYYAINVASCVEVRVITSADAIVKKKAYYNL